MNKRILLTLLTAALALSACGGKTAAQPTLDPNIAMTQAFATVHAAFTQTALAVPTNTPLPTETPTPLASPTPTPFVPTVVLPAVVNTVVVWCRFGPDTVYVARFGLRSGKTLEAIGRTEAGDWLLVREIGGVKSCWSSAAYLAVSGDIATLPVAPVVWVTSEKYPPPANVTATRSGDQVQISWSEVTISDIRDIYAEGRYLLELWLCSGGALTRTLINATATAVTVTDQPGCAEASHGQIYTATRDGYSLPAIIPWP